MFFEGMEFAKKIGGGGGAVFSEKEIKVYDLIRSYRIYGHLKAQLDPLGLQSRTCAELELATHGLDEKDLNSSFTVGAVVGMKGAKLKEIVAFLEKVYCGHVAVEFTDCPPEIRKWMLKEYEQTAFTLTEKEMLESHHCLTRTEALEKFIHTRFVGAKRFSIEGGDALMPMMEHLLRLSAQEDVLEIVIGMAHRGRVNMLANYCGKPLDLIFSEFEGAFNQNQGYVADGDVKYHMGFSSDRKVDDKTVHLSMAFNPSHLEVVNPVVSGMTRAKQRLRKDNRERKRVLPVAIHGDAAFIGQGVVPETLQLSQLEGYAVGGTLHLVVNNQVGFTTSPEYSRSSTYCTDVAKSLRVPVIHVNGDDLQACLCAMTLAYKFRQTFRQDVVIDLVCYRRYGHNEGDEPGYTQPVMYSKVKGHPTLREIFSSSLVEKGLLGEKQPATDLDREMDRMQEMLDRARKDGVTPRFFTLEGVWKGLRRPNPQDFWVKVETGVEKATLQRVGKILTSWPEGFTPHPKLVKQLEGRKKMMEPGGELDWGMAELLAYGGLIAEGIPVRISGQDAGRGTFGHRHSIFHDLNNGTRYSPLNTIQPDVADFAVHDSSLSEYAVLGFEYGNSITDPRALTIWEAQFGDFANGAQIIIDQFIASAESKWQRMAGLVLLLPHGYEGQGPEHSSARLERFLQLCAQENMQVAYPTTPAQIFHLLRRQVIRDWRKPLVVMSPKSMLRHPKVVSPLSELEKGSFRELISDPAANKEPEKVKKVIFCTGKIYYELADEREKTVTDGSVAIMRVEQLYPLPTEQALKELRQFPNLKTIIWAQEEPKNMGAYSFVAPRMQEAFMELAGKGVSFRYVGRTERASPAIGSPKVHSQEQLEIIKGCFK